MYLVGIFDLVLQTREILQPHLDTSQACLIWCPEPERSCSPVLLPRRHVWSGVPNPWDPAAPTWYLVDMFDLMCYTREILQPCPDTSYACWNCCSELVRSCSPVLMPRRHVRSDVPYPWDPAAPSWYLEDIYDLMFLTVRSCSPTLIPRRHVRSGVPNPWDPAAPSWYLVGTYDLMFLNRRILQPHPATSQACPIWCSLLERSCSPVLIPCRHVRSGVPDLWNPTAPSWYLVGILDLLFQTIEILQPRPDTL